MFIEDPDAGKIGTQAHVLDICATALALAGYKILDGDRDGIIIRRVCSSAFEVDYQIKVEEVAS